jgi:hypothetical protein
MFQYQSYSHSDDIFIILKSTINTDTSIFVFSREKLHDSKYSKYASLKPSIMFYVIRKVLMFAIKKNNVNEYHN